MIQSKRTYSFESESSLIRMYNRRTEQRMPYLASNHSSRPPYEQHQERNQSTPLLQYNVPWPNYFQHRTGQKQNYRGERSDRRDRIWYYPWYRAQDPWEQPWERIYRQKPHCNRHWSSPVEDQRKDLRCIFRWRRYRAHRRWLPRTWIRFGCRIGHLEREGFLSWCLVWRKWKTERPLVLMKMDRREEHEGESIHYKTQREPEIWGLIW